MTSDARHRVPAIDNPTCSAILVQTYIRIIRIKTRERVKGENNISYHFRDVTSEFYSANTKHADCHNTRVSVGRADWLINILKYPHLMGLKTPDNFKRTTRLDTRHSNTDWLNSTLTQPNTLSLVRKFVTQHSTPDIIWRLVHPDLPLTALCNDSTGRRGHALEMLHWESKTRCGGRNRRIIRICMCVM